MKNIAKALSVFHSEMGNVAKDANNPFFKSKYAPLESILPAIKKPMEKAGLTFTQIPSGLCKLKTQIIDIESGEFIEGEFEMTPAKNDPQGQGGAITYMRRYALVAMLGLNCDEDDDGNTASQKPKSESKEMTPDEAFKKASQALKEAETLDDLNVVRTQITKSKIITNEKKQELEFIYTEKSETFDPTK